MSSCLFWNSLASFAGVARTFIGPTLLHCRITIRTAICMICWLVNFGILLSNVYHLGPITLNVRILRVWSSHGLSFRSYGIFPVSRFCSVVTLTFDRLTSNSLHWWDGPDSLNFDLLRLSFLSQRRTRFRNDPSYDVSSGSLNLTTLLYTLLNYIQVNKNRIKNA